MEGPYREASKPPLDALTDRVRELEVQLADAVVDVQLCKSALNRRDVLAVGLAICLTLALIAIGWTA